jgi:hypothetical protein
VCGLQLTGTWTGRGNVGSLGAMTWGVFVCVISGCSMELSACQMCPLSLSAPSLRRITATRMKHWYAAASSSLPLAGGAPGATREKAYLLYFSRTRGVRQPTRFLPEGEVSRAEAVMSPPGPNGVLNQGCLA